MKSKIIIIYNMYIKYPIASTSRNEVIRENNKKSSYKHMFHLILF